jgi:hypothetical protein
MAGGQWLARTMAWIPLEEAVATPFYQCYFDAGENALARKAMRDAVEKECRAGCYARANGKIGCIDCIDDDTEEGTDFDHIDPSKKTARVSTLLHDGKYVEARVESIGTVIRCALHHREKGIMNGDHPGPPRLPPSDNPTVERQREHARGLNAIIYANGRQRNIDAKIARGCCARCKKPCTKENYRHFDWNHRDPMTKKRKISSMSRYPDDEYDLEVAECDLLCHSPCHSIITKEQRANGTLSLKTRKTNEAKRQKK